MENHKKHSLGHRAFFLFLFKRIKFAIFLFLLTWFVWYGAKWFPAEYRFWDVYAAELLLMISIAYFVLVLLRTLLEYNYHTYKFTEEAFVVTEGYVVHNETAALYHQIQSVNIRRNVLDRLIGVSQLIIMMTGRDREGKHDQIILPAVGRNKARLVQKEILTRARKHENFNQEESVN